MIDKMELSIKTSQIRKKLGEDESSPIDIFALSQTIDSLTLMFYPLGKNISGACFKNSNSYYAIFANGCGSITESFELNDTNKYEKANYFSEENLSANIARAQTLQRKLWRRSAELCEKMNLRDSETQKYGITYDVDNNGLYISSAWNLNDFGQVYFDTKEHAEQVIKEFKDELIWYFTEFQSRMD